MPKNKDCEICGAPIPYEKLVKHPTQKYCSVAHAAQGNAQHLKLIGHYQEFSQAGNAAQRRMQEETGIRPGHNARSAAAKRSNQEKPRRHTSGWKKNKKKE